MTMVPAVMAHAHAPRAIALEAVHPASASVTLRRCALIKTIPTTCIALSKADVGSTELQGESECCAQNDFHHGDVPQATPRRELAELGLAWLPTTTRPQASGHRLRLS
jgi:hypothetical protein